MGQALHSRNELKCNSVSNTKVHMYTLRMLHQKTKKYLINIFFIFFALYSSYGKCFKYDWNWVWFFFKIWKSFGGGFLRNCFSIGKWFGAKSVPQPFFVQTTTSFLFSINVFLEVWRDDSIFKSFLWSLVGWCLNPRSKCQRNARELAMATFAWGKAIGWFLSFFLLLFPFLF